MLSRTADHLYWMARYIERAENMARVLDVAHSMSLVPDAAATEAELWEAALAMSGNREIFDSEHARFAATEAINFLAMDDDNPSSIFNCLRNARENARAVRVALPTETWENINTLWLEFNQLIKAPLNQDNLHDFCEWVKSRSHLFRGVCFGTMLRDDAFRFVRLGGFIERADNTARLLDVKYVALHAENQQDLAVDYYEWSAVLRSVSAFQAYQKIFSDTIHPGLVAELLVLREDMPRSLHACYAEILPILDQLAGRRTLECRRLAGEIHASLKFGRMDQIFEQGLHTFLSDFILRNNRLGQEIFRTFLSATTS